MARVFPDDCRGAVPNPYDLVVLSAGLCRSVQARFQEVSQPLEALQEVASGRVSQGGMEEVAVEVIAMSSEGFDDPEGADSRSPPEAASDSAPGSSAEAEDAALEAALLAMARQAAAVGKAARACDAQADAQQSGDAGSAAPLRVRL